nr:E2/UBC family protein [uncultured Sphingomonas sp.]
MSKLERWLTATLGATEVPPGDFLEGFSHAWEISTKVAGTDVGLRVLLDERFPWSKPRVALANPPKFPSYPHVEASGLICVFADVDEADPDEPIGVAAASLAGALRVLTEGINGTNADDFRSEFLSYWDPLTNGTARSIVHPCGPSRLIRFWDGKKLLLAAEDEDELRNWLANFLRKKSVADIRVGTGLLVWLPAPLLPDQYPSTPDEVLSLAISVGAGEQLLGLLRDVKTDPLVLFGASTGNGTCFAGVRLGANGVHVAKRIMKVYGAGAMHTLNNAFKVVRLAVDRADPWWVHGRDGNADLTDLISSSITIIGNGSIGSPLARLLAQAGVGCLDLIDPELLQFANIGRHALGADSVGQYKAERLAKLLGHDFPHGRFNAHEKPWQELADVIANSELVIAAVGSWSQEGELNALQLTRGTPPTIYAWLEPHGAAAHAVLLGRGSGCLQCHLGRHGEPKGQVVDFDERTLKQAPACGAFFQPYGPTATMMAAGLAADLALDHLLGRADVGEHRAVSGRAAAVESVGGQWSQAWTTRCGAGAESGRLQVFEWMPVLDCRACGGNGLP